jgi:endonuclease YncB( thermonuclease family)
MRNVWATRGFLGLVLLGAGHLPVFAGDSVYGKVIAVRSAEVVTLDYGTGRYEIRIAGIDAQTSQSKAAEQRVISLVLRKNARMRLVGRAKYGGMVAQLLTDDPVDGIKDVAVDLLERGLAKRQLADDSRFGYKYGELKTAEDKAKTAHLGLWAGVHVRPP